MSTNQAERRPLPKPHEITSGPWTLNKCTFDGAVIGWHIAGRPHGSVYPICRKECFEGGESASQSIADGAAIAALPDILAECEKLKAELKDALIASDLNGGFSAKWFDHCQKASAECEKLKAELATMKEENCVLRSQVENADVNLEQVRMNARAMWRSKLESCESAIKAKDAELATAREQARELRAAAKLTVEMHDRLFIECGSNPVKNWEGKEINMLLLNDAACASQKALASTASLEVSE